VPGLALRPTVHQVFPADCPHRTDFYCPCTPEKGRITQTSTVGYSEFPAYGRLHTASLPKRRAAPIALYGNFYLRHVCYYSKPASTSRHLPRAARSFLPSSSCRHEGRTVSSSLTNQPSWDWIFRLVREPHVQSLRILQVLARYSWSAACHWHSCHTQDAPAARTHRWTGALSVAWTAQSRQMLRSHSA
jgi:hypothetical protein